MAAAPLLSGPALPVVYIVRLFGGDG